MATGVPVPAVSDGRMRRMSLPHLDPGALKAIVESPDEPHPTEAVRAQRRSLRLDA
jgi:hypothetical protein